MTVPQQALPVDEWKAKLGITTSDLIKPWKGGDPLIVVVWGPYSSGKTHFAFTASSLCPVFLFDFEHNTSEVARHPQFKDKLIVRQTYFVPVLGVTGWKQQAEAQANKFRKDYYDALTLATQQHVQCCFVIDSVTKVWELLRYAYVPIDDAGRTGSAWNYGFVNSLYQALFDEPRFKGHHFVGTCRTNNLWVDKRKTELLEADWKEPETPFNASIILQADQIDTGTHMTVKKCTPNLKLKGTDWREMTFTDLIGLVESYE